MYPSFFESNKIKIRGASKIILSSIVENVAPPDDIVQALGVTEEIKKIRDVYNEFKDFDVNESPKYLPFYRFIKTKFPDFKWEVKQAKKNLVVIFNKPYINSITPTLLNLVVSAINDDVKVTPRLKVLYPSLRKLPDNLVYDLDVLFKKYEFCPLKACYSSELARVLRRGLAGEAVTIVSPVCPDYAFERHNGKYRYTFSHLGDGIGLVAGRLVKILPKFRDVLEKNGIKVNIVVSGGDFEGYEASTLYQLGETREGFQRKLKISQKKIGKCIGGNFKSSMISELLGGEESWFQYKEQVKNRIKSDDYGFIDRSDMDILAVFNARLPLYRAWQPTLSNRELAKFLYDQIAEYALIGKAFSENYENAIVVGADHSKMRPFYWLYQKLPVLYLKRIY